MNRKEIIKAFDPNNVGLKNGNFIGLPFDEASAQIILMPVNWDATVSYKDGTSTGPQNILHASSQLDLEDYDVTDAWKYGIFMRPSSLYWLKSNAKTRKKAIEYIDKLEAGFSAETDSKLQKKLDYVNEKCEELLEWVEFETEKLLGRGKMVGLIGGDHSTPLGYIKALSKKEGEFGILTIDAHFDQRKAYEDFTYSHASIFHNVLALVPEVTKITHIGIRDYCDSEKIKAAEDNRINVLYDADLKNRQFAGETFKSIIESTIAELPEKVYISFDIDGLKPELCPNTGTPVPGGLEFHEAVFILNAVVNSGRKIIGFDLSETGAIGNEWDGNVAARIVYKLCNLMGKSNNLETE